MGVLLVVQIQYGIWIQLQCPMNMSYLYPWMFHGYNKLPSGKRLHSYGTSPCYIAKPTINSQIELLQTAPHPASITIYA